MELGTGPPTNLGVPVFPLPAVCFGFKTSAEATDYRMTSAEATDYRKTSTEATDYRKTSAEATVYRKTSAEATDYGHQP